MRHGYRRAAWQRRISRCRKKTRQSNTRKHLLATSRTKRCELRQLPEGDAMSYFFLNFRHLIGDLAEEGQRVEARGDLQDDMAAIARGRAFLEIAARLEDTHIGSSALTAQPLMDAGAWGVAEPALPRPPHNGTIYIQFAESPRAHGGERIRKWSRQPFEGALKFECTTYQANPRDTHDMSPRLRGALASIIADPDCCAASKSIARDALRRSVDGRGSSQ